MATGTPTSWQPGDSLLLRVRGNSTLTAEQEVLRIGKIVDTHRMGQWDAFPIGLGEEAWWFDVTPANLAAAVAIILIVGTTPDRIY